MTKHTHGFLLLLGIVLLGGGIYVAFQSYQAKSWPTTTARVTESELRAPQNERYGVLGKPMHARPKKLAVQYEYRIGGKSYTNDRVTFGSRSGSSMVSLSGSPGALVELAKGKAVTVHYNPNDPSDSVIETELPLTVPLLDDIDYF